MAATSEFFMAWCAAHGTTAHYERLTKFGGKGGKCVECNRLRAFHNMRRLRAERKALGVVPTCSPVKALSEIDARNRTIKAAVNDELSESYKALDREWEVITEDLGIVYQVYGWSHDYRPDEIKVGICDIAADRFGGTRTDDRHFVPVVHFVIPVGTKEQAKRIEAAFKERYADRRLPHVRTGSLSEFFDMAGPHAENAVRKIIREEGWRDS